MRVTLLRNDFPHALKSFVTAALTLAVGAFGVSQAHARPPTAQQSAAVPCAVLEAYGGQAQLLDSSRTHLLTTAPRTGIACGSWLSVEMGWARVRHRDGQLLHIGSDSFIQFPENNPDGKHNGDSLVLYKGQVHVGSEGDTGVFRVLTSNARARLGRGQGVVVFSPYDEETQLISIEGRPTLENRFQDGRRMAVKAGEATSLNFKVLRVVPSTPRVVAIAALRQRLVDLHLPERDQVHALELARGRQERVFAVILDKDGEAVVSHLGGEFAHGKPDATTLPTETVSERIASKSRMPASRPAHHLAPRGDYRRHIPAKDNAVAERRWTRKLIGNEKDGERILFPGEFHGAPQEIKLVVIDPLEKENRKKKQVEDAEKKRLIEELSKLRAE